MKRYHARPPGEADSNWISPEEISARAAAVELNNTSSSSSSSSSSVSAKALEADNNAPPRSRYGREYKRARPFTPPTAARSKRHNTILAFPEAEPEPPLALDFDDVVDDPDTEPSDDEVMDVGPSSEADGSSAEQPAIGFFCPFEQCKPASVRWLSVDRLTKHLVQVHVRAGQHPPPAFLDAIGRWECAKCEALHSVRQQCPRAHEPNAALPPPPVASHDPLSAKAILDEIKAYDNCLHHIPHGSEDLMASFTASLLDKAASSGRLGDMRALFLAPRVVLSHLRRSGKKHEAQVRAAQPGCAIG